MDRSILDRVLEDDERPAEKPCPPAPVLERIRDQATSVRKKLRHPVLAAPERSRLALKTRVAELALTGECRKLVGNTPKVGARARITADDIKIVIDTDVRMNSIWGAALPIALVVLGWARAARKSVAGTMAKVEGKIADKGNDRSLNERQRLAVTALGTGLRRTRDRLRAQQQDRAGKQARAQASAETERTEETRHLQQQQVLGRLVAEARGEAAAPIVPVGAAPDKKPGKAGARGKAPAQRGARTPDAQRTLGSTAAEQEQVFVSLLVIADELDVPRLEVTGNEPLPALLSALPISMAVENLTAAVVLTALLEGTPDLQELLGVSLEALQSDLQQEQVASDTYLELWALLRGVADAQLLTAGAHWLVVREVKAAAKELLESGDLSEEEADRLSRDLQRLLSLEESLLKQAQERRDETLAAAEARAAEKAGRTAEGRLIDVMMRLSRRDKVSWDEVRGTLGTYQRLREQDAGSGMIPPLADDDEDDDDDDGDEGGGRRYTRH